MPFNFTPEQRAALSNRLMIQPPENAADVREFERMRQRRRIEGLPLDVLLTLESLKLLAEQGNRTAAALYASERIRLGIDRPSWHGR